MDSRTNCPVCLAEHNGFPIVKDQPEECTQKFNCRKCSTFLVPDDLADALEQFDRSKRPLLCGWIFRRNKEGSHPTLDVRRPTT